MQSTTVSAQTHSHPHSQTQHQSPTQITKLLGPSSPGSEESDSQKSPGATTTDHTNAPNVHFKNYTVTNPHTGQQNHEPTPTTTAMSTHANYPTPNNTPTPVNPLTTQSKANKNTFSELKDSNGYPILSRDFVVRRISEGETGRLKEELKCESCGKGYKHITSLAKHLWEHTTEWQKTKKLLISKHQQAQLLEAASILCSIGEKPQPSPQALSPQEDSDGSGHVLSPTPSSTPLAKLSSQSSEATNSNSCLNPEFSKLFHNQSQRRKSKSEHSNKAGKFGGKRRSKSFVLADPFTATAAAVAVNALHNSALPSEENDNSYHLSSTRRDSDAMNPPSSIRRGSMLNSKVSFSASRRGSLIGSLIKEENENNNNHSNQHDHSLVIYDSEDDE